MPTDIYIGIDGTGPGNDATYTAKFENSHVHSFHKLWSGGASHYHRGPTNMGLQTGPMSVWATSTAKAAMQAAGGEGRLFLCGFSRGGAIAISAARWLEMDGIPVRHLMLFDAVDRSPVPGLDRIPDNVEVCSHARRDPKAGSREMFGNCGTTHGPKTSYRERPFFCSHGAVGGTPWTEANESGKVQEIGRTASAAGLGVSVSPVMPVHKRGDLAGKVAVNTYTNVTLKDERAGAQASFMWMREQLGETRLG